MSGRAFFVIASIAACASLLGACGGKQRAGAPPEERPGIVSAEKIDRVTLGNGLVIEDLKLGDGAVCLPGARVRVKYTGTVQGAPTSFDTNGTVTREMDLGGNLIRGWKEGLPGMRVGGTRKLTIPPEMAYGSREVKDAGGSVVVPAGSTLVYVVDLVGLADQ